MKMQNFTTTRAGSLNIIKNPNRMYYHRIINSSYALTIIYRNGKVRYYITKDLASRVQISLKISNLYNNSENAYY